MKDKNKYDYLLKEYPPVITKDQLYRICHISKRTAKHLLDNGYIPCINSGKKTRKYKIELTDVIKYLETRDKTPEVFAAPVGWYKTGAKYKGSRSRPKELSEEEKNKLSAVYSSRMIYYPDILSAQDVSKITGYHRNTVAKWCSKKWLFCFHMGNKYVIPKISLLEFMLGPEFQGLKSKIE